MVAALLRRAVGSQRTALARPVRSFVACGAHAAHRGGQSRRCTRMGLCPCRLHRVGGKRAALLCRTHVLTSRRIPCRDQHAPQGNATAHARAVGIFRYAEHRTHA